MRERISPRRLALIGVVLLLHFTEGCKQESSIEVGSAESLATALPASISKGLLDARTTESEGRSVLEAFFALNVPAQILALDDVTGLRLSCPAFSMRKLALQAIPEEWVMRFGNALEAARAVPQRRLVFFDKVVAPHECTTGGSANTWVKFPVVAEDGQHALVYFQHGDIILALFVRGPGGWEFIDSQVIHSP